MPKVLINNFSSGLNNEIDEGLLDRGFSTKLINSDTDSGILVPVKPLTKTSSPGIPFLDRQDGTKSIVRFGDDFFESNNDTGELTSTAGFFGITPPESRLEVSPGDVGDRFEGEYKYFYVFDDGEGNVSSPGITNDLDSGVTSINVTLTKTTTLVQSNFPAFEATYPFGVGNKFSTTAPVSVFSPRRHVVVIQYRAPSYVNHNGRSWRLRYFMKIFLDGVSAPNDGGPDFHTIPEHYQPGGSGNYWEDVTSGTINVNGLESIKLNGFSKPVEPGVKFIRIYRTIAGGTAFFLIDKIDKDSASYTDLKNDNEIINNETYNDKRRFTLPPVYKSVRGRMEKVGAKYLTEVNERYWVASGDTLFHSLQSDPHSWDPLHALKLDGEITGIAKYQDGLIVFIGNGNPYLVRGDFEFGTISKQQIPNTIGCPNWATIAYAGDTPIWQSFDGIATILSRPDGQGPAVSIISTGRYQFDSIANSAVSHKNKYYLFFDDKTVVLDLLRNKFYELSVTADFGFGSNLNGTLYLSKDGELLSDEINPDAVSLEQVYKSPIISPADNDVLKNFKLLSISGEGRIVYSVWLDRQLVLEDKVIEFEKPGNRDIKLPSKDSYNIQIELKSTGLIYFYAIEFTANKQGES